MKKQLLSIFSAFVLTSFSAVAADVVSVEKYNVLLPDNELIPVPEYADTFPKGLDMGYGSGLAWKGITAEGELEFYGITDRGPNLDSLQYEQKGKQAVPTKIFPKPDFAPRIGVIRISERQATVVSSLPIRNQQGQLISGRPLPQGRVGATGEIGLAMNLTPLPSDVNGLDPEGFLTDKDGNFWISDEYGPFVVQLDPEGKEIKRYAPGQGLPDILQQRTPNRGGEGLTMSPNGHLWLLVQSPLNINGKTKNLANFSRLVEIDPETDEVKTYAYPVTKGDYKKNGQMKLGDIYALSDHTFLVIEQGKSVDGSMHNWIQCIDVRDATDITDLKINGNYPEFSPEATGVAFKPLKKELLVDLRELGWTTEKAEGLTMLPNRKTIAVINDNDFGVMTDVKATDSDDPDIKDYIYREKTADIINEDGEKVDITITMNEGPDKNELWLITFAEPLK